MTSGGQAVTSDGQFVTSGGLAVTSDGHVVTSGSQAVTSHGHVVTSGSQAVTSHGHVVTSGGPVWILSVYVSEYLTFVMVSFYDNRQINDQTYKRRFNCRKLLIFLTVASTV
jgi:hypothetical protein